MTPPDDTATIERDLAAVDAALAGDPATAAPELRELALALRAEAPQPEPEFAERLGRRVEKGFPRQPHAFRRARRSGGLGKLTRDLAPLGGLAVTILAIVGITIALSGGDGARTMSGDDGGGGGGGAALPDSGSQESAGGGGGDDGGGVAPEEPALSRSGGDTVAPVEPLPRDQSFVPGQRNRKIERSFSMELDVPLDEMARVADEVTAVTNRHGGFVLNSSVSSGEDGGGGDFSLRIPTDRLRPALRDLAELAPVIRQSQQGRDVTREHVTAKDRLQAARAERRSLLRRLEEADTDEEAEAIRRRLDLVAGEINGLRAQLRDLRLRTDYAVVTVSLLVADGEGGAGGGGGSFDDAVGDAGDLLVGFAGVLIRVLALAIPLGLIALAAWLASRAARRRRRESALA